MTAVASIVLLVASVCPATLFAQAGVEHVFYVAPHGNDTNTGDEADPFISIVQAQQAVREKIAAGLTGNIRVLVRGGVYELGKPLVFTPQDSGTEKFSITYATVSNEMVVVSGGRRIANWTKGDGNIWTAELPEVKDGQWYFRNLYVNGRRATRARSPNAKDSAPYYRIKGFDKNTWALTLGAGQVSAWKNLGDVEAVYIGSWSIFRKRIHFADPITSTLVLEPPYLPTYELPSAGSECYLENARSFLDQPGEWYLDRTSGILSYWPHAGEDLATTVVVAPRLTTLMEIKGAARQPVRNLHFVGLTFANTDSLLPNQGYIGVGHGMFRISEKEPAHLIDSAMHWEFAHTCSVEDGCFTQLGGNGLLIDKGCAQSLIQGNRIVDVGGIGITLGIHRSAIPQIWPSQTEQPQSNQIINNVISHCGTVYHDATAVLVRIANQTLVAHNLIYDCAHHGIAVATLRETLPAGWCVGYQIVNNDISHVCQMMSDSGPIYAVGRQVGNDVISGNVVHDTRAYGAVYFDDDSSGYRVEQNVIYGIQGDLTHFTNCRRESFVVRDNYWQGTNGFVRGKIGYALSFTPDQFLDLPHQTAMESPQLTVEAWVNLYKPPTGTDPSAWVLCKNGHELTDGNYALVVSHNNVGAYLNIGGGRENCYAAWSLTGPLQPGTWHLLALTYDATNLSVFCDGKLAGTTPVNRQRTTGSGPLRLGKRSDGYNPSFPGLINEISLYNRALSADEISAHYAQPKIDNRQLTPDGVGQASGVPPALAFHWNANDTYSALEQIMSHAGPEEPYRSRFIEQKSEVSGQRPEVSGQKADGGGGK